MNERWICGVAAGCEQELRRSGPWWALSHAPYEEKSDWITGRGTDEASEPVLNLSDLIVFLHIE